VGELIGQTQQREKRIEIDIFSPTKNEGKKKSKKFYNETGA